MFIATVLVLCAATFAVAMTRSMSYDEQMFVTAAVLVSQGKVLYRDFAYLQAPYYPLLLGLVLRVAGSGHYLLTARIVTGLCDVVVLVCVIAVFVRVFDKHRLEGMLLGAAAGALLVFSPVWLATMGLSSTQNLVMCCTALALLVVINGRPGISPTLPQIAAVAILLTAATLARLSAVWIEILFLIFITVKCRRNHKECLRTAGVFVGAAVLTAIPAIWVIAHAPKAFYIDQFQFAHAYKELLKVVGAAFGKVELVLVSLTVPGGVVLVLVGLYLYISIVCNRRRIHDVHLGTELLPVLLLAPLIVMMASPLEVFPQHLGVIVPFLIISFAYPLRHLRQLSAGIHEARQFRLACAVVAACTIVSVVSTPDALARVRLLPDLQKWTGIAVHTQAQDTFRQTPDPRLVLTPYPLYALEGGCQIYLELASAPLSYGIAAGLTPDERRLAMLASPDSVAELYRQRPASAIAIFREQQYIEEPLFELVGGIWDQSGFDEDSWQKKKQADGLIVYIRRQ